MGDRQREVSGARGGGISVAFAGGFMGDGLKKFGGLATNFSQGFSLKNKTVPAGEAGFGGLTGSKPRVL